MTASFEWAEVIGQQSKRQEYTKLILELGSGKDEALSTWLVILELVSITLNYSSEDEQQEWTQLQEYLKQLYLGSPTTTTPDRSRSALCLPTNVVHSLESVLRFPSSSSSSSSSTPLLDATTRSTLATTIRAGLEYLSSHAPPTKSPISSTPLPDQFMLLLNKKDFPRPPSANTRESIVMASRENAGLNSVASILLSHYVFPIGETAPPTPPSSSSSAQTHNATPSDSEEEEDNVDRRSVQTGIQEARESIIRKDEKLLWLLGKDFHKGPSCRSASSTINNNLSVPTTSTTGSFTSSSGSSTIRRPASSTPTASRIYQDESNSTIGALPEFPSTSRSFAEPRDSVDSFAPSTISDSHRHSRLISTSSSTAPLLSSARPSTTSATSSPHRRVLSAGVLPTSNSTSTTPFTLNHFESSLDSPGLPTPPLQPLDSPSRPFAHLQDLPSSSSSNSYSRTQRNSLDSAKDDLLFGRRESIPFGLCQELSEKEKSELVRRNKKLEKLLGGESLHSGPKKIGTGPKNGVEGSGVKVQRRRWHSEESQLAEGGDGFEGRRMARPVSISIPSLRLGAQSPAQVSPTTVLPDDDLSPTSSHPTNSTTTRPTATLMHRSSSTPSPLTSPSRSSRPSLDLHLFPSNSSSTSTARTARPRNLHHRSSSQSSSTFDQEKRDERRRKLEKVRRVLGERVPLGLVVHTKPQLYDYEEHELAPPAVGGGKGGNAMMKSKSRQMGEKLKEVFVKAEAAAGGGESSKKRSSAREQDRENWVGTQSAPQLGVSGSEKRTTKMSAPGGIQGVEALTKARKLESLFGDLPPQSLYLAPASPLATSTARAPLLKHRRSHSDIGSASRSPSISTSSSPYGSARGSLDLDLCRTRSNSSSVASYQRSIASLRYVLEQDPGALDEVVRAYTGGDASTSAQQPETSTSSADSRDDNPSTALPRTLPSSSSSSQAAVRKAQKLSSFFGTTKGEVWKRLLDDIAGAVAEDEELEDEERREVLESLEKLREGAQHEQHQQLTVHA